MKVNNQVTLDVNIIKNKGNLNNSGAKLDSSGTGNVPDPPMPGVTYTPSSPESISDDIATKGLVYSRSSSGTGNVPDPPSKM